MSTAAIAIDLRRHCEDLARQEWGENALHPIGPTLTALLPLEPATDKQRRWHVVQTHAQQESLVEREIAKLKLDAYCPREPRKIRVNAHKHREVKRPILVSYVFAGFDASSESWEVICGLRGVMRLIMVANRPLPIGDAEMQRIQFIEQERAGGRCARPIPKEYKIGELLRILDPLCFAGLFGFVTALDAKAYEIGVDIDIFGRKVPLRLKPEQVEVV